MKTLIRKISVAGSRRGRRIAGFSIMETLAATLILALALAFTIQVVLTTARVSNAVSTHTTFEDKSRAGLDYLATDIQSAYWCMTQYPPTGTATYTADSNKTLILCLPVINNDYSLATITTGTPAAPTASPLNYDYVIYRVIQPATAAMATDGPWELTRTVVAGSGSYRVAGTTVMLKNIQIDPSDTAHVRPYSSFTSIANQALPGSSSTCVNLVTTVCTLATSYTIPTTATPTCEIIANGVDKTGITVVAANLMTTTPAVATPTAPSPTPTGYSQPQYINARYTVDPTVADTQVSPSNGRNYTCEVIARFTQQGVAQSGNTTSSTTLPSVTTTTQVTLRNRPALQ